jgi:biopolymer transport protein ExbB
MIRSIAAALIATLIPLGAETAPKGWWNPAWTQRQAFTIDAGAAGLSEDIADTTVLVRLHDGNFQFANAAQGGADLRFVSKDGKTVFPHHIERFDNLINEGFVWVKIPTVKAGEKTTLYLYYGGSEGTGATTATDSYDDNTALALQFGQAGANFQDGTKNANSSSNPGVTADAGIIGSGLRLLDTPLLIPASPSLDWKSGQELTWSAWIRPAALQDNAVIFSKSSGGSSFRLLLNQGVPIIQIGSSVSPAGEALAPAAWTHVAFTAADGKIQLYINGLPTTSLAAALPELSAESVLGGLAAGIPETGTTKYNGELDSLIISNTVRPSDWIKLAAVSQGTTDIAPKALFLSEVEAAGGKGDSHGGGAMEHIALFGDIAGNMMFDGWIAIGVCVLMIIVGWTIAFQKFNYLNKSQKATELFKQKWKAVSKDLTAIDHEDEASIATFGGSADARTQSIIKHSPLYHIYHIGSEEISNRLAPGKNQQAGLSRRSIIAIRAALDGGLVHETHKLTNGLIYLTISIAGGPYIGLLGTVVGVMITFAIIAKSGEVDVNSIAPGIASALLATVAGLIVAIPALFIYSYLNSRIKETTSDMQVFIDEFVAKMAEFYPPVGKPLTRSQLSDQADKSE